MNPFRRLLAHYRDDLEPDDTVVTRTRARVEASRAAFASQRALLASLDEVPPHAEPRVRRRLAASLAQAPRRSNARWALPGLGAATVVAALALVLRTGGTIPLSAQLHADDVREDTLTSAVTLTYQGTGAVAGTDRAPALTWERGELLVSVEPGRGVALSVVTPEAHVDVIGTVFTVNRDALGTRVSVTRGHVRVGCERGPGAELASGDAVVCLPVTAAGLLSRAHTLADGGALPAEVLASVALGLSSAPETPVRHELLALRVTTLALAGDRSAARAAADALLAEGGGLRRAAVARIAGQIALTDEGCAAALPYIEAIPEPEREPGDRRAYTACHGAPSTPSTP